MSDDVSLRRERQIPARSGSFALWGLLIIAVLVAGLLGYMLRPLIDGGVSNTSSSADNGLSELARSQVSDAITTALTPIDSSLKELRKMVDPEAEDPTVSRQDIEQISNHLINLREHIERQIEQMEKLVETGDAELRSGIVQSMSDINERLANVDALSASVDQLVADQAELNNRVVAARPIIDQQEGDQGSAGEDSSTGQDDSTSQDDSTGQSLGNEGTLIIDNTSTSEAQILINGQPETLKLGRNYFTVPVENIVVSHPQSSLEWQLDATLWDRSADGFVIHRQWSQ